MARVTANLDEQTFTILNAIVLKLSTSVDAVAASTNIAAATVAGTVRELAADGHVVARGGRLAPGERAFDLIKRYNEDHWGELRRLPEVQRWHQRFEHADDQLRTAFEDWHRVEIGQHASGDRDKVISRIDAIVAKLAGLLDQLSGLVPRFRRYGQRLEAAMEHVEHDSRYVSDPHVESARNVWFELQEDVLLFLGRGRIRPVQDGHGPTHQEGEHDEPH